MRGILVGLVLVAQACSAEETDGVDGAAGSSGGSSSLEGSTADSSAASKSVSGGTSVATSSSKTSATSSGGTGGATTVVTKTVVTSASGGSGSGGAAGASFDGEGFYCPDAQGDSPLHCDAGQECVQCYHDVELEHRCVPSVQRDLDGYERGTADCDVISPIIECDGPEDCLDGEYCVTVGRVRCASELLFGSCCLSCDAIPACTFCRVDADCGEAAVCAYDALLGEGVGGCKLKPCDDDDPCPMGYSCQSSVCVPEE